MQIKRGLSSPACQNVRYITEKIAKKNTGSKYSTVPYYDTRIRGSRIGAWASQQSQVLRDRSELEQQVDQIEQKFEGQEKIPVPEFWGGLRVKPNMVEFWQGRTSRLHDRFRYTKDGAAGWKIERLSP